MDTETQNAVAESPEIKENILIKDEPFENEDCKIEIEESVLVKDEFTDDKNMIIQYLKNNLGKKVECSQCQFQAKNIFALKLHSIHAHKQYEEVKKPVREKCPYNMKCLANSSNSCNNQHTVNMVECPLCKEKFAERALRIHIAQAHIAHYEFECTQCEQKYKSEGNLNRHIMFKHFPKNEYQCDRCEKKFGNGFVLRRHIQVAHSSTAEKSFRCKRCPFRTKALRNLEDHVNAKHTMAQKITWFKCPKCPFICKTRSYLRSHTMHNCLHQ